MISMYNLAHIYFYGDFNEEFVDKKIDLLIKSANKNFFPSKIVLCIALMKKISTISLQTISDELKNHGNKSNELNKEIFKLIKKNYLEDDILYAKIYSFFEDVVYLYDFNFIIKEFSEIIQSNSKRIKETITRKAVDIQDLFYEGFGFDLLCQILDLSQQ